VATGGKGLVLLGRARRRGGEEAAMRQSQRGKSKEQGARRKGAKASKHTKGITQRERERES
jgi:hypothetical protein